MRPQARQKTLTEAIDGSIPLTRLPLKWRAFDALRAGINFETGPGTVRA